MARINVTNVERRVGVIKSLMGDPESAHSAEDQLYVEVLTTIANGNRNAIELARAALVTQDLEFPRWCA